MACLSWAPLTFSFAMPNLVRTEIGDPPIPLPIVLSHVGR